MSAPLNFPAHAGKTSTTQTSGAGAIAVARPLAALGGATHGSNHTLVRRGNARGPRLRGRRSPLRARRGALVNALGKLRFRFRVTLDELARRLGITRADVETIEGTPLRLLEVDSVRRYVEALGCRLDLVACHIDGEAVWLGDDDDAPQGPPACPECGLPMAELAGPGNARGWTCTHCEVQP